MLQNLWRERQYPNESVCRNAAPSALPPAQNKTAVCLCSLGQDDLELSARSMWLFVGHNTERVDIDSLPRKGYAAHPSEFRRSSI